MGVSETNRPFKKGGQGLPGTTKTSGNQAQALFCAGYWLQRSKSSGAPNVWDGHNFVGSNEKSIGTLHPVKTNEFPLKNNGWFRCISYWNSPFLGDMLVFRGVVVWGTTLKINMGSIIMEVSVQIIFLQKMGDGCRFQPLISQGVHRWWNLAPLYRDYDKPLQGSHY